MWIKLLLGVLIGGIGGFIYNKLIGCPTNNCPLTKTPLRSVIYGITIGIFVAIS